MPVTKHNYLVMKASDIGSVMHEAFHIARTGRPGPVLIDIPKDVFVELAEYDFAKDSKIDLPGYNPYLKIDQNQIEKAVDLIN